MKTSSAKAKGRRCSQEVASLIENTLELPSGNIWVTPSGVTGADVILSQAVESHFPFAIECKNQESLNIWSALEQAAGHSERLPGALFFKRNRSELYVAMKAKDLLQIFKTLKQLKLDVQRSGYAGLQRVQEAGKEIID